MNVNDITETSETPLDIWAEIFVKQWEIARKYKDIEEMDALLENTKFNLDTKEGQIWIKDFAWRVTEELAEASEALDLWEQSEQKEELHLQHGLEELIDALHFLVELSIIAGYDKTIVPWAPNGSNSVWDIVYELGLACNCLKNKKWKQTQMLTDRVKFTECLTEAWASLLSIFELFEMEEADVYQLYFKKNEVNKFRIKSKY